LVHVHRRARTVHGITAGRPINGRRGGPLLEGDETFNEQVTGWSCCGSRRRASGQHEGVECHLDSASPSPGRSTDVRRRCAPSCTLLHGTSGLESANIAVTVALGAPRSGVTPPGTSARTTSTTRAVISRGPRACAWRARSPGELPVGVGPGLVDVGPGTLGVCPLPWDSAAGVSRPSCRRPTAGREVGPASHRWRTGSPVVHREPLIYGV